MADNKEARHTQPDLSNPEMRHEHADVNVWAIGKVAIALVLVTLASIFLMFGVFRYFEVRENALQPPPPPPTGLDARKLPPEPNLLYNENESGNLKEIRENEDKLLNTYGWNDQAHKVIRIPIDRAMDLLVQRGPASRPPAGAKAPEAQGKK